MRPSLQALITLFLVLFAGDAAAAELRGVVRSAWDGRPVRGVEVTVDATERRVWTDATGAYRVDVPEAPNRWSLTLTHEVAGERTVIQWVDQTPQRAGVLWVFPAGESPESRPAFGAPGALPPDAASPPPQPLEIPGLSGDPRLATIGARLPDTIRVGRRFASSCSGNPVQRIDTVPFEEYVQGVLVPEIGVFKRISGGPESSRAVFQSFAIAARSYAYWFWLRAPDAEFHIDDTACNQRYEEARDSFVAEAVADTAGIIFVSNSSPTTIDKYEYAASCGRHGSRPAYQTPLVADVTSENACVGSWCGHNTCAAHEVNPAVPDGGRCLVRGICQWGAAERSMRGDTWQQIVAHYQPNLRTIRLTGAVPTRLLGFVRFDDLTTGTGVPGVGVTTDTGDEATTDGNGLYTFEDVPSGLRTLTFRGSAIRDASRTKDVVAGTTNWASLVVEPVGTLSDASIDVAPDDVSVPSDVPADAGDLGDMPDTPTDAPATDATTPREDATTPREDAALDDPPVDTSDAARDSNPPDTSAPDLTGGPDSGEGESALLDADSTLDGTPTGLLDTTERPRRPVAEADADPPLQGWSTVGSRGLGDTGCAAASAPASPLLLFATLFPLIARRRRPRHP